MEMTKMIEELQEKLGEEYEIELACNEKNNGICMQGMLKGNGLIFSWTISVDSKIY